MSKYTYEQRMEAVKNVVDKHMSCRAAGKLLGCGEASVNRWVKLYQIYGVEGVIIKHGTYNGAFKQQVIEYMHEKHLSTKVTAVHFGIPQDHTVGKWERIYYEEGPQALYEERRGRSNHMTGKRKGKPPKLQPEIQEDLIAENQRLRMENEYLKKLNALVRARNEQEQKKG